MIDKNELNRRLQLPLDAKIFHFVSVFTEFFIRYHGEVALMWSAGKDSDTGCDIVDKLWSGEFIGKYITKETWELITSYSKPKRVFCNTGLEFPELVERVKDRQAVYGDVVILKPKMGFVRAVKEVGYAIGSKKISMMLSRLAKYKLNPSDRNKASRVLYETGIKSDGTKSAHFKIPKRFMRLIDAPFKVSDKCCDIFKKEPYEEYQKETGLKPVIFTTTEESSQRTMSYMQTGCNSFEKGKEKCRPFSIFTERDTWLYAERFGIRFASVYYDRVVDVEQTDGSKKTCSLEAEKRTGCMWCGMGVHLEPKDKNNRIQRLALSHPKYYDAIVNKGGLGDVLAYCDIPYKPLEDGNDHSQQSI